MTETLDNMRELLAPLVVLVCGMLVLLLDLRRKAFAARKSLALVCQLGLLLAGIACAPALLSANDAGAKLLAADQSQARLFGAGMTLDGFGALLNLILCLVAALVIGMSGRYLEDKKLPLGEFYALILFASAGAMVMTCALDLINLFVGLEVLSVALYILAGYARRELRSEEAAVKYFLLGAFASGFLLYGIALIYGAVGLAVKTGDLRPTTPSYTSLVTLTEVLQATAKHAGMSLAQSPLFLVGMVLVLVGLGFKAS
ncbi:NADH-quinone oxidoreductase subunit N, partial [Armatimonas sp.]|uniref:NADH-quinone oxidoreductase subunit N n=1 Tax=Armatimonas sp. TaxID=1872638 RepID=UPI003751FC9E